jgi:Tol biopolymer transport system component
VNEVRRLSWAPDGRSLFAAGWDKGPPGVFRIDLATLEARQLVRIEPAILLSPVVTPDGSTLYFSRYRSAGDETALFAFDLVEEEERELRTVAGRVSNLTLSPDGATLAVSTRREAGGDSAGGGGTHLLLLPLTGGDLRVLAEVPGFVDFDGLRWSADGGSLLYVRLTGSADLRALERIGLDGGEPERLLELTGMRQLLVHPDGRRLAFQAGAFRGEVWALENLR